MAKLNKKAEYVFETSWEVCNKVGGIYTVLSTRAATLQKELGDKLIFIGPDVWSNQKNPLFEEDLQLMSDWREFTLQEYGLDVRVGRWLIPGRPLAVLVDFKSLIQYKNEIYGRVWSQVGVNSMAAYGDYDESSLFGYATGMVMVSYYRFYKMNASNQVIAHFNEWMTTFGAFYVREHEPQIATVFTTHATSIGRSIAGNQKPLYDCLGAYNGDQMAVELNMVSKHSTEKICAHIVDCFTTVSDITAIECAQLLEKKPDVVTPNGFENDFVPKGKEFELKRKEARVALAKVAQTLFGYEIEEDALFVGTAGRYEYKNKGLDVLIESLKRLSDYQELKKQVVMFIMVPAWVRTYRHDLKDCLDRNKVLSSGNRTTTHDLHDYYNDNILGALHWFQFHNHISDRVKVVYVPSYLNGNDGVFNKDYYDLLIGMDLTVFPSYYEPWGYTPLESVAFSVPTITTDLSGFGQWVSSDSQDIVQGVGIIHRSDYNYHQVAYEISKMIIAFSILQPDEMVEVRKKAKKVGEKALWKHFIKYYYEAYSIALEKKELRINKYV